MLWLTLVSPDTDLQHSTWVRQSMLSYFVSNIENTETRYLTLFTPRPPTCFPFNNEDTTYI